MTRLLPGEHSRWATAVDLLFPLLILFPILWALLPGGLPSTADGYVHFIRSAEMVHAWQDGVLIPRWSANLGVGLGIPLFVYAPPLPYLLTAGLHWLGLPLEMALKGTMVVAMVLMSGGAYKLARDPLGPWAGMVSAIAVVYAPVTLRELFIQGNVAQLLAWSLIPWTFWAVLRIYAGAGWRGAIWLGLAAAGVMLSHNAVSLLLAELTAVQVLVMWIFTRRGRAFAQAAAGGLLGLALSAWFWPAALLEGKYVQLDKIVASDYHNRFLTLQELLALSPRLDMGAINPYYPLTLGAIQAILGILGIGTLVVLVLDRSSRTSVQQKPAQSLHQSYESAESRSYLLAAGFFFAGLAIFGALMALPWSAPIWERLPFLDLLEFPFRWHGFTLVAIGWLAGLAVFAIQRYAPAAGVAFAAGASAVLMGAAIVNLYPDKLPIESWASSPAAVVRYEVKTHAVGTTSLGEFTPIWAENSLLAMSPFAESYPEVGKPNRLSPAVNGQPLASAVQSLRYGVELAQPMTATFNLLYFPGWQVLANGVALPTAPETGSGLLQVGLPAGAADLSLTFTGTPLRRASEAVALTAWIAVVTAGAWAIVKRRRAPAAPVARAPMAAPALVFGVMGLLVAGVILLRGATPAWFRLASPPDQALDAGVTLRADFADKVRLLGIDPPPATVKAGDALSLAVYLRALQPLRQNYGLFLHLDRPDGATVATADVTHPGEIPTRGWATGLHVRAPLTLKIPADALPIRYDLHLGMLDPITGEWLAPAGEADAVINLGQVWVEPRTEPQPPSGPRARFGEEIHLLGAAYQAEAQAIHLYWRTDAPIGQDLSIFAHFLDKNGQRVGQADGAAYENLYPTRAWRPGQVIEDVRPLPLGVDPAELASVAIGVYDPTTGVRLPATDEQGTRLADDALQLSTR